MKSHLIFAVFLALALAVSAHNDDSHSQSHVIQARQITVKPPFPRCVFYECIGNCKQRGYKNGGYCTINGCQCLR